MTTLLVHIADTTIVFTVGDGTHTASIGLRHLADVIVSDPPQPAELTNAIGMVLDHLDDADRELPGMVGVDELHISGAGLDVLAAVEVGATVSLPFAMQRDSAEEVFRTLATEPSTDRMLNPGLTNEWVHRIVPLSAAVVAIARGRSADRMVFTAEVR